MSVVLHDFQTAAVNAAVASINARRNDLIVIPTGGGKSHVIASIIERFLPSQSRILVVTHIREIIAHDGNVLSAHLPGLDYGIYCAGLDRYEPGKQIVLASVQSLYRRTYPRGFDIVLVDEAHLIPRRSTSMYQQLFTFLQRVSNSRVPILGLSATPYRLDSGYLHQGADALFDRIAYEAPITALIERGILAPLTVDDVEEIDFSDLPIRGDEYVIKAFEEKTNWLGETARSLAITQRLAAERRKWLIFGCSIRHCLAISEMLIADGISAVAITHRMRKHERSEALSAFKEGECRALVNVDLVATGFDSPRIDCVVSLRPTLSTGKWIQQLGRGMRSFPGKTNCLLLDFAGNLAQHGAMTDFIPHIEKHVHDRQERNRPSRAATKMCPKCATILHARHRQCSECGELFVRFDVRPSTIDPIYPMNQDERLMARSRNQHQHMRIDPEDDAIIRGADAPEIREDGMPLYLWHRNGVYYYLRKVPERSRPRVGLTYWRFSLRTTDKDRATQLARRLAARHDRILGEERPIGRPPPSAFPYLGTEEAAALIGVAPAYAKQMRHYGTGPKFFKGGAITQVGWRWIVYRMEDIEAWRNKRVYIAGNDGRTWRLEPSVFAARTLAKLQEKDSPDV